MKVRVPDYYKDFKCIASECEDTCCAGWVVVIDDEAYEKYKNVGGNFGERLRKEIICDEGDNVFTLKNDNCAFLNERKLCDIYKELGEGGLCHVCRQFPRIKEEFGSLREEGISLSCPEAARLILNNPRKIEFQLSETHEQVTQESDIDENHLRIFMECRSRILQLLQNRNMKLDVRAALALRFTEDLQEKIDWDEMEEIQAIMERYSNEAFIKDSIEELEAYKNSEKIKYHIMKQWIDVYGNLTHINNNDPLDLEKMLECFYGKDKTLEFYINSHEEFHKYYQENEYKFEQILVYFIFRYFMKAIFDYDVSAKMKIAVLSYLIIKESCIVRWMENAYKFEDRDMVEIAHTYSKDVEHLEENIDLLSKLFLESDIFEEEKIITALMN